MVWNPWMLLNGEKPICCWIIMLLVETAMNWGQTMIPSPSQFFQRNTENCWVWLSNAVSWGWTVTGPCFPVVFDLRPKWSHFFPPIPQYQSLGRFFHGFSQDFAVQSQCRRTSLATWKLAQRPGRIAGAHWRSRDVMNLMNQWTKNHQFFTPFMRTLGPWCVVCLGARRLGRELLWQWAYLEGHGRFSSCSWGKLASQVFPMCYACRIPIGWSMPCISSWFVGDFFFRGLGNWRGDLAEDCWPQTPTGYFSHKSSTFCSVPRKTWLRPRLFTWGIPFSWKEISGSFVIYIWLLKKEPRGASSMSSMGWHLEHHHHQTAWTWDPSPFPKKTCWLVPLGASEASQSICQ